MCTVHEYWFIWQWTWNCRTYAWIDGKEDYELDISDKRFHHEIYISDKRFHHEIYISDVSKTVPEKVKTIIRHPIRKK